MGKTLQKITPFLWFDSQAEEAAHFYVAIFQNSKVRGITRYDEEGARAAGRPKGSGTFKFTEAISLVVNCETQAEVDHFWGRLSAGDQEVQCG